MISRDAADLIRSDAMRAGIRTDKELAQRIGMKPSLLSQKLKGKVTITAAELARIFQVTMSQPDTILLIMKGGFTR